MRHWSDSEIALLRTMAGRPVTEIRSVIKRECGTDRSYNAINCKAVRMKISLELTDFTTSSLGTIFGVDRSTVSIWIDKRMLAAYRSKNKPGCSWMITSA